MSYAKLAVALAKSRGKLVNCFACNNKAGWRPGSWVRC